MKHTFFKSFAGKMENKNNAFQGIMKACCVCDVETIDGNHYNSI